MKINLKSSKSLFCGATGPSGMSINWKKNHQIISDSEMHSVNVTEDGTNMNVTIQSALTITANPSLVLSEFKCIVKSLTTRECECVADYQCQIYYKGLPRDVISSSTVKVEVIGLRSK